MGLADKVGREGVALVWKAHPGSLGGSVLNTEAAYFIVSISIFFKSETEVDLSLEPFPWSTLGLLAPNL